MSREAAAQPPATGWLRERRERSLLTQEELAARSGVDARTIRDIETGRTAQPRPSTVRLLIEALSGVATEPHREAARPPAQLPADVAGFTGRDAELAELDALLDQDAGGTMLLSAVAGTAGVGKTALAVHWAHRVRDRFPDGQLFVNLRGYDPAQPLPPDQALAGFLGALGVPGHDMPLDLDERAARYRSETAHRRLLVVLDNASSVEQVRPLLPGGSGCAVVVTSRDALAGLVAVHGARRVQVELLPAGDSLALLRRLIGRRVDADPVAAVALARQCARLPLALRVAAELAASRPDQSTGELVAELADERRRLDLLDAAGDPRAAVTAVFSWSYRSLPAHAARMFRLLGLHPGHDLDAAAAAALAGVDTTEAVRLLGTLLRAHLIQAVGTGRYGMHDLLRAYAARLVRVQDDEVTGRAAAGRLIDHYLVTATAAVNHLYPAERSHRPRAVTAHPTGPDLTAPAARDWLDAECAVLTSLVAYCADHGWRRQAVELSITLYRYFYEGHNAEAVVIHECARAAARADGDRAGEAHALVSLGVTNALGGRPERAVGQLREAVALYRTLDDRYGLSRALNNLGCVEERLGHYEEAIDQMSASVELARQAGETRALAHALGSLGYASMWLGRYELAAGALEEATAIMRESGDLWALSRSLTNLGLVHHLRGEYETAAEYHRQAAAVAGSYGDRLGEAHALAGLADVDAHTGRLTEAAQGFQRTLASFRRAGDRHNEAWALNGLGEVDRLTGRPAAAIARHTEALALATQVNYRPQQSRAHEGLGNAFHDLGDSGSARDHWRQALAIYEDLKLPLAERVRERLGSA
jgi:tetratricopeptide (TPR) repeat protein/transcriptional regulator with XRE-family HTH domain